MRIAFYRRLDTAEVRREAVARVGEDGVVTLEIIEMEEDDYDSLWFTLEEGVRDLALLLKTGEEKVYHLTDGAAFLKVLPAKFRTAYFWAVEEEGD